jgi:hypothetical protein
MVWRASPWLALLIVSFMAAYALEFPVTSALTLAAAGPVVPGSTSTSVPERVASGGPRQMLLTMRLRDPATGTETSFQCVATSEPMPHDDPVVDADTLAEAAGGLCAPG